MVPNAPYLYACDHDWWDVYYHEVKKNFKGRRFTKEDAVRDDINTSSLYDIERISAKNGEGLGREHLVYGQNSGYQAVNLAYILGAKTVVLLGFDMNPSGHWFGEHAEQKLNKRSPYHQFIDCFESLKPERYDLEIINCTRQTALHCFPCVPLERVFE